MRGVAVYRGAKLIGLVPVQTRAGRTHRKVVILGTATLTLTSGPARRVTVILDGLGRRQLVLEGALDISLVATQGSGAQTTTLISRRLHLTAK